MANRVHSFQVTVPTATLLAAPQVTPLGFREGIVRRIEVTIPSGVVGLAGFAFTYDGEWILPFDRGDWFISNDEKMAWDVDNQPTGSRWELTAYNLDAFDHTFYIRFLVDEFPVEATAQTLPIRITT